MGEQELVSCHIHSPARNCSVQTKSRLTAGVGRLSGRLRAIYFEHGMFAFCLSKLSSLIHYEMNSMSVFEQIYHVFSWQINLAGTSGHLRQWSDG